MVVYALKLAQAITIHKAQGLTLGYWKGVSAGLMFVACSCMHCLSDIMFDSPFAYQCVLRACS